MAAMGQPLLGDAVRRASRCTKEKRGQARSDTPPPTSDTPATSTRSKAVKRAGTQLSTSSARAAHLPAQAQLPPWYRPG